MKRLTNQYLHTYMYVYSVGCPGMHKSWKCHAPEAKSDAKTLIFWENIKIWAVN